MEARQGLKNPLNRLKLFCCSPCKYDLKNGLNLSIPMQKKPLFWIFSAFLLGLFSVTGCRNSPGSAPLEPTQARLMTRMGHGEDVLSIALSNDGEWAVTGSADYTARVWRVASRKEMWRLVGHTGSVIAVAFSPDTKWIATGGEDRLVCLWEMESGERKTCLQGHQGGILSVQFSPDGKLLASSSEDDTAKIWDLEDEKLIQTLTGHQDFVETIVFAGSSQKAITASLDGTAKVWDLASGKALKTYSGHKLELWDAAYSSPNNLIATASADRSIRLWRMQGDSIKVQKEIVVNWNGWEAVTFSKDGRYVVGGNTDKTVRMFRSTDGLEIRKFEGHQDRVWAVAFDPQGRYIASASGDKTVRLWSPDTGKEIGQLGTPADLVTAVAFSPDQKTMMTFQHNHKLTRWQAAQKVQTFQLGSGPTGTAHFSGDGRYILTSGPHDTAVLWRTDNGQKIQTFPRVNRFRLIAGDLSYDGRLLGFGEPDGTVSIYEASSGRLQKRLGKVGSPVGHIAFSKDGSQVAATYAERDIKILSVQSGGALQTLKGHPAALSSISLSSDGQLVAVTCRNGEGFIWNTQNATQAGKFKTAYPLSIVRFAPSGDELLTVDIYGNTAIWQSDGDEEQKMAAPGTTSAVFSPDGTYVLAGHIDGTTKIWSADTGFSAFDLTTLTDGRWLVAASNSKFFIPDTTKAQALYWVVEGNERPFKSLRNDYYDASLLNTFLKQN